MKPRRLSSSVPCSIAAFALVAAALALVPALGLVSCAVPGQHASAAGATGGSELKSGTSPAESAAVFVPLRYLVGDEVEALIPLGEHPEGPSKGFELRLGAGLPLTGAFADPVIRSVTVERGSSGWDARILFVPWSPGPGILPSMAARGMVIPPVPYNVSSSLGSEGCDAAPSRPQREPPGTALYLYGFAGFVLFLALSALGAALYLVPAARAILARWRAAQAFRRLRRSVAFLSRGSESAVPELFYAALARELRIYLAERIEPRSPNLSATEFAALPEETFPAPGIRESAAALIGETERGRYAGELAAGPSTAAILRAAAERAIALGGAAEEAIDAGL